jgi:hypothetical protein
MTKSLRTDPYGLTPRDSRAYYSYLGVSIKNNLHIVLLLTS